MSVLRPVLLDVNVLIALFDSTHIHHEAAHAWFSVAKARGWRTCPLTENGFLRILSNPAYPNGLLSVLSPAERLEEFKKSSLDHVFWADEFSASEWLFPTGRAVPSAKLTDAYLLKLAGRQKGALATFICESRPPLSAKMRARFSNISRRRSEFSGREKLVGAADFAHGAGIKGCPQRFRHPVSFPKWCCQD